MSFFRNSINNQFHFFTNINAISLSTITSFKNDKFQSEKILGGGGGEN
jgi:hypothetical protein